MTDEEAKAIMADESKPIEERTAAAKHLLKFAVYPANVEFERSSWAHEPMEKGWAGPLIGK